MAMDLITKPCLAYSASRKLKRNVFDKAILVSMNADTKSTFVKHYYFPYM